MNRIQEASWRLALSEGSPIARRRTEGRAAKPGTTQPALQRLLDSLKLSPPPTG